MIIKNGILMRAEKKDIVNGEVIIPEEVKEIAPAAFIGIDNLKRIAIPNGVKKIGDLAFFMCSNLKLVKIAESVSVIGSKAFALCPKLSYVFIPQHVQLKPYAFKKCRNLNFLYCEGNDLNIFETSVFDGCDNLSHHYKHIKTY